MSPSRMLLSATGFSISAARERCMDISIKSINSTWTGHNIPTYEVSRISCKVHSLRSFCNFCKHRIFIWILSGSAAVRRNRYPGFLSRKKWKFQQRFAWLFNDIESQGNSFPISASWVFASAVRFLPLLKAKDLVPEENFRRMEKSWAPQMVITAICNMKWFLPKFIRKNNVSVQVFS